ncbi:MAG TPA: tetratricopeptide repeat protein [Hyphomicrobiales bacterium]|nr:tetratricopeptide repeat protein [Hyphomicrobiales bacterium]
MRQRVLVCLFTVLLAGPALADQNDPELGSLFDNLRNTRDPVAAAPIEARIWDLWFEHDNPDANRLMQLGLAQMNTNAPQAAVATFTQLIELEPEFAEAWNRRATLYYLLGDYAASKADVDQVLKLEPYHFAALSGLGLVHLALHEYFQARSAFNAALEINPSMQGVRENLRQLEGLLQERAI